jgi:hypothetical protein
MGRFSLRGGDRLVVVFAALVLTQVAALAQTIAPARSLSELKEETVSRVERGIYAAVVAMA